ncbi:MAG: hypothetical protein GTO20_03430 [Candidatus Aminicenantes bacterium]|nr:hypothetical protein [Candidatus Aminicenantes bacterium]
MTIGRPIVVSPPGLMAIGRQIVIVSVGFLTIEVPFVAATVGKMTINWEGKQLRRKRSNVGARKS